MKKEIFHLIEPTFYKYRCYDIMVDEFKVWMTNPVRYILFSTSEEVIHYCDFMSVSHQSIY